MEIGINTYSLRNEFKHPKIHDAVIKIANDLGIKKVEILDSHCSSDLDSLDAAELKTLVKKYNDAGIDVFSLAPHTKLLTKEELVKSQIEDGTKWLNLAHEVGAKYIRVQLSDGPFMRAFPPMDDFDDEEWEDYREQMHEASEFTDKVAVPLLEVAEDLGVGIGIETHHSYSSNYIYQEEVNKRYDSKYLGWVFDIGNYENDDLRWKALDVIKERVFYIHAKSYKYDERGFETTLDYPRACKILAEAGFDGVWSIEFEGKYNGILGIMQTHQLVKYSIAQLKGEPYTIKTDFGSIEDLMKKYGA